jgi:hypothetical protein
MTRVLMSVIYCNLMITLSMSVMGISQLDSILF